MQNKNLGEIELYGLEINGAELYGLFSGALLGLKKNEQTLNALNVFPVPDGDTGSNMLKTLEGGVEAADKIESASVMAKALSKGSLFSARGNSGVILSQFIRGFANGLDGKDTISTADFIDAMQSGVESAYKAVMKPVEGTSLTVLRETAEFLNQNKQKATDFKALFQLLIPVMSESLENTPDKLPVLKEAGVVDSGGAGILCMFEGMQAIIEGKELPEQIIQTKQKSTTASKLSADGELEYGYCTEFILQLLDRKAPIKDFSLDTLIDFLDNIGDSVVAVMDEDIVKVHVHTFTPEKVLEFAHKFGEFLTLKIENMSVQHNEAEEVAEANARAEHKKFAIVSTAQGKGMGEYFSAIGADAIVFGGNTQNPSAEDFIKAFKRISADYIIVLPNNSNIVMAASLAASLYTEADVRVIKTHSAAEGYSALSMIDPFAQTIDEFIEAMSSCLDSVTTVSVTTSVRDAFMNGISIKKGSYIGLDGENILCSVDDKITAALTTVKALPDIDLKETIIVFYGNDVTNEERDALESELRDAFPLFDIGFIEGGQPLYSFIISVE